MTDVNNTINMAELVGSEETNPVKKTKTEIMLATVDASDASAETIEQAKFQFRDLITPESLKELKTNAPAIATKMINDYKEILNFGEPVLQKLNQGSIQLLKAQKDIEIPEAEHIVNNLLRTLDGYSQKYRSTDMEGFLGGLKKFFKTGAYNLKAMVRDAQPIADKIDLAEKELRRMELSLSDNITRGQELHRLTVEVLDEVVTVLAALEEIDEYARKEFTILDDLVKEVETKQDNGNGLINIEYKGKKITANELRFIHTNYANGIKQLEQTWFDWRQQFFLGYATAPSITNIILVATTMQRRCQTFRTMGLPSARRSLANWNNAAHIRQVAERNTLISDATNTLMQESAKAAADATVYAAKAAEDPIVSEETIFSMIESVRVQCEGLVAADKWGREVRARSLQALEQGEKGIQTVFVESRRALVESTLDVARQAVTPAPAPEANVLKELGILK